MKEFDTYIEERESGKGNDGPVTTDEYLTGILKQIPKEMLLVVILNLLIDGAVSFTEIADIYNGYLNDLRRMNTRQLARLRGKIISMWCGNKKDIPEALTSLMQEAKDNGWANITQEDIDNSKWSRGRHK